MRNSFDHFFIYMTYLFSNKIKMSMSNHYSLWLIGLYRYKFLNMNFYLVRKSFVRIFLIPVLSLFLLFYSLYHGNRTSAMNFVTLLYLYKIYKPFYSHVKYSLLMNNKILLIYLYWSDTHININKSFDFVCWQCYIIISSEIKRIFLIADYDQTKWQADSMGEGGEVL